MRQSFHQGCVVLHRPGLGLAVSVFLLGCSGLMVTDAAAQLRRPPADPDAGVAVVQPAKPASPIQKSPQGTIRLGAFQANAQAVVDLTIPRETRMLQGRSLTPSSAPAPHYTVAASESLPVEAPVSASLPRREPVLPSEPLNTKPTRPNSPPVQAVVPAPHIPVATPVSLPSKEEAPQPQRNGANARSFTAADVVNEDMQPKAAPQLAAPKLENAKVVSPAAKPEGDKTASPSTQAVAARDASKPDAEKSAPSRSDTSLPDPDKVVFVVDQDLRQFLIDFSRRFGLRSDVAQSVRGRLTKVKLPIDPTALLKELEKRFDLEWMIEGDLLKVTSRSDLATRILPLGPLSYEEVIRELKVVDIDTSRYPLRKLSDSNAIITTAPTGHIGRVSALIDALRAGKSLGPDLRIVKFGSSQKVQWD